MLSIKGGYDPTVAANVQYMKYLQNIAKENQLSFVTSGKGIKSTSDILINHSVIFIPDISEVLKIKMMKNCRALLYTPSNEHFGIVPVEAMTCHCPVIAVNSGGLKESVLSKFTLEIFRFTTILFHD
jgi:alpha-1,3/alpha-1,6-mannosyltransferase